MINGNWPQAIDVPGMPHLRLDKSSPALAIQVHDAITRSGRFLASEFGPDAADMPLEAVEAGLAFTEAQQLAGHSGTYYLRDIQIRTDTVFGGVGVRRSRPAPPVVPGRSVEQMLEGVGRITIGLIGYYRTADAHDLPPLPDGSRRINMPRVVGALIEEAGRQGINEVNAWINPKNTPSIHLMQRLGAQRDEIRPHLAAAMDAEALQRGIDQLPYVVGTPEDVVYTIRDVTSYKIPDSLL